MTTAYSDRHDARDQGDSMTIVVCTHSASRWKTLASGVSIVTKQMRFDDELIVVVDHNQPLLARCRDGLGGCTVISNSHNRGLSGARNTALEEARQSIIVFLDDDAVPFDGWLDALRGPYSDGQIHGVGGFTVPHWAGRVPKWFPDEFLWVVGCSHRGLPTDQHQVRNLVGANMSFRKSAFDRVGGFVESMGRVGRRPLGCEETEFSIRLTQVIPEATLLYNPAAQVEHHVSPQRESLLYFLRRCWAEGLSKAEVSRRVGRSNALSVERQYVSRVLPSGIWRGLRDSAAGDRWGAARSAAIVLGLAVTTAGYGAGTLRRSHNLDGDVR
jgi:GT2 family glycosyltransferase